MSEHEYTRRELKNVTREALTQLADRYRGARHDLADRALAALAQLDSEPAPDLREPYVARFDVQPGLHLTVDASHNIILEARTPDEAGLLAAYALGDVVKLADTAANCRSVVRIAEESGPEVARVVARDWAGTPAPETSHG